MEIDNVNPDIENVAAIFFWLEFSQMPANHDLSYLSLHLLEWNESKVLIFIKI